MAQIAQFASRKGVWQAGRAGETKHGPDSPVRVEKGGLAGRNGRLNAAGPR